MKFIIIQKKDDCGFWFNKIWEEASIFHKYKYLITDNIENVLDELKKHRGEIVYLQGDFIPCGIDFGEFDLSFCFFSGKNKIFKNAIVFKNIDIFIESINYLKDISKLSDLELINKFPFNPIKGLVEEFRYSGPDPLFLTCLDKVDNLFKEFICKTIYSRFYSNKESFIAVHGGDIGDIIYTVPAFKKLNVNKIILNPGGFYNTKMSHKLASTLKPFLEINNFEVDIKEDVTINDGDLFFDFFREGVKDMENNHLILSNCEKIFIKPNISEFKLEIAPKYLADIIIARSSRYRNTNFDYRYLLNDMPENIKIAFVGLKEEYENFIKIYGMRERIFYYPTANFKDLAQVIKGCKVFIGNQSAPYAVSELLKVNRIQECCKYTANCKGSSNNSLDVITQEDLYSAKKFIFDTLNVKKDILPLNKKTILISLISFNDEMDYKRILFWIKHHMSFKSVLNFDNMLLIDNGSDREYFVRLKQEFVDSHIEFISLKNFQNIIPFIIKERDLSVLSFKDRIVVNSEDIIPDFWRGYLFGVVVAFNLGYEKIIYISDKSYILSQRMALWARNENRFSCVYETPSNIINTSIQIIPKQKFPYLSSLFYGKNGINEEFFYGFNRDKYFYKPEYFLKFENDFSDFEDFKIKRYYNKEKILEDCDFVQIDCNNNEIFYDRIYELENIIKDSGGRCELCKK
jgi:hypothetical protein